MTRGRRGLRARATTVALSLMVVAAAIGVSMLVVAATGSPPLDALGALWAGAFGGRGQIAGTLTRTIPTYLAALGWIVAITTLRINVGLEGQILFGGIGAVLVGLHFDGLAAPIHLALGVVAAVAFGAGYAGIAAWLWARRHVNELLSTLLLTFFAFHVVEWLVRGPLQESGGVLAHTDRVHSSGRWPVIQAQGSLSLDVLFVPLLGVGIWLLISRTRMGYELRLSGANPGAAQHAGISTVRIGVKALLLSGGLAGFAGASRILGSESSRMSDGFSAGHGFEGIVVALLARNHPLGALPAALLFGALRQGGGLMEARVGVPSGLVGVTQGVVILLVALTEYVHRRRERLRVDESGEAGVTRPVAAEAPPELPGKVMG